jgi:hypothetical protein
MSRAPDARPPNGNGELPARRVQNRLTTAVDSNSGHSFAQATGATTQFALAQRWKREAERLLRLFWQSGNDAALVAFCLHVRGMRARIFNQRRRVPTSLYRKILLLLRGTRP